MRISVRMPESPSQKEWDRAVEWHFALTLRPLGGRIKRVDFWLRVDRDGRETPVFVSRLAAHTGRDSVTVQTSHPDARTSIAMAFSRARRDVLRRVGTYRA